MRELSPTHYLAVDEHPASDSYAYLTRTKRTLTHRDIYPEFFTMTRSEYHEWARKEET